LNIVAFEFVAFVAPEELLVSNTYPPFCGMVKEVSLVVGLAPRAFAMARIVWAR
jgi:hypothetical protein